MPHIIVMHSVQNQIDVKPLLQRLHDSLTAFDSIKISTTKAYDIPVGGIIVGNGSADEESIYRCACTRGAVSKSVHPWRKTCTILLAILSMGKISKARSRLKFMN